jgi:anthranilate phosphoribosyltransferase
VLFIGFGLKLAFTTRRRPPTTETPGDIPCHHPQEALQRTIEHREVFHDEMLHIVRLIMSGECSPVMMAALITGLRVKKETIGEITAAAQVMREVATKVPVADATHLVDIVGTGGDGSHTFNISTCSMFVAAAAGAKVSKHGGRSVSSKSGSADVLESLGVNINLKPEQIAPGIAEVGIGFMFAPNHHPAMKNVAPVRKELGIKTIFNILGPLTNPAGAPNILMGVFHPTWWASRCARCSARRRACAGGLRARRHGRDLAGRGHHGGRAQGRRDPRVRDCTRGLRLSPCRATARCGWRRPSSRRRCCGRAATTRPAGARHRALNAGAALYAANVVGFDRSGIERARAAIASGAAGQAGELVKAHGR